MFSNLYPVRKLIQYDNDIEITYSFQNLGSELISSNWVYQAGCLEFLWVTRDITQGDFCNTLKMVVAKRLEVTAVKVSQHNQPPY